MDPNDPSLEETAPGSRTQAFGTGAQESSGLIRSSAVQNAMAGQGYRPSSVLSQFIPSANGMSQTDASRRLLGGSGMMPTANGMSQSTYEAARPMMSPMMNA